MDDNSLKWGTLTPGRNIPIVAPSALAAEPGRLAILVMAWNFYDEVRRKIQALRGGRGDECLRYIPAVSRERLGGGADRSRGTAGCAGRGADGRCRRRREVAVVGNTAHRAGEGDE